MVLNDRHYQVICFHCGGRGWLDGVGDELVAAISRRVASGMRDHATIRAVYRQHESTGRSIYAMRPDAPEVFELMLAPGYRVTYKLVQRERDLVYVPDRTGWSEIPSARITMIAKQLASGCGNGFMLCTTGDPYRLL